MTVGVRRSAVVIALGAVGAAGAFVACSLTTDLDGFSEPVRREAGSDALTAPDTSVVDAGVEAAGEAAPPPGDPPTVIDTPFTSMLDTWSPRSFHQDDGYPKVESFFGSPAAVLIPFVDTTPVPIDAGNPDAGPTFFNPPERLDAIGGIWQTTPVSLRSFDLSVDIYVRCTKADSCADGVGIGWFDTTTVPSLSESNKGHIMGFPPSVSGAAVIADVFRNDATESSDPPVPALEVVKLDATKTIGHYPWVVGSIGVDFRAAWHTLTISVRGSAVTVGYDGTQSFNGTVPMVTKGLVGISGGTGGQTDAVAVRNVKGSFYDCTP
jgi:hypothetical protein